jgi:hypothetical protein
MVSKWRLPHLLDYVHETSTETNYRSSPGQARHRVQEAKVRSRQITLSILEFIPIGLTTVKVMNGGCSRGSDVRRSGFPTGQPQDCEEHRCTSRLGGRIEHLFSITSALQWT